MAPGSSSFLRESNVTPPQLYSPKDFIWGVGISAYQTEGAARTEGRGPSIWDAFPAHKIKDLRNAELSCDFYNRYDQDLGLVSWLGLDHFKTSISWSRIFPEGFGPINQKGLDFYKRLTDEQLKRGITPWYVLYHWDLPQALEEKGGWTNRDTVQRFLDYAHVVVEALNDCVDRWIVMNEPFVFVGAGHFLGIHAPGRSGLRSFLPAVHHVNLANGMGVNLLQSVANGKVGTALSFAPVYPANKSASNSAAARRCDKLVNHLFLDPIIKASYPQEELRFLNKIEKYVQTSDMSNMQCNPDFLGVQVYTREVVKQQWSIPYLKASLIPADKRGKLVTNLGQEVYPNALLEILDKLKLEVPDIPLIATECGISMEEDDTSENIRDSYRINYYNRVLQSVKHHMRSRRLQGLFFWSLMDNYEWAEGYTAPFGLFKTNFDSLARTPKASAFWVKEFMATQRKDMTADTSEVQ